MRLPCFRWHRAIVVPDGHPLGEISKPTMAELAQYPLVTYSFSFSGPASLVELFAEEGLTPNVALTAWDSDVIKKYVREGLGVGILANIAIDGEEDADLKVRDASHLFPVHTTWAGFRRGVLLRGYIYDFLQMLAPHLTQRQVQAAENADTQEEVDREFADGEDSLPALGWANARHFDGDVREFLVHGQRAPEIFRVLVRRRGDAQHHRVLRAADPPHVQIGDLRRHRARSMTSRTSATTGASISASSRIRPESRSKP